jgi:hypothetical protein
MGDSQAAKPTDIVILVGSLKLEAELFDTPTGRAVADALPVAAAPKEWGDEFYFEVPVDLPLDPAATVKIKAGDIGYWPPGRALAVFFGPTPMSTGPDPVPAGAVNIIGRLRGDAGLLRQAKGAREIRVEKA